MKRLSNACPQRGRRTFPRARRRGFAILLVLGLMAVTLAVAYATLRGQGTTGQLVLNNSRARDAREAARSGLSAALRKMSEDGWAGVGTPLSANITDSSWYNVSFSTGDAKLPLSDPEWPFHVGIESVGTSVDPTNVAVKTTHTSRCIVRLVRRAIQSEPANWTALTTPTIYQWGNRDVSMQFPVRVNGQATLLGHVLLYPDYPGGSSARNQYFSDLALRIAFGKPDHRPFQSPLTLALSRQDATNLNLLQFKLNLTTVDSTASTSNPLTHPGIVTSYKLYPGGKSFTVPTLQVTYGSSTLANLTIGPDPQENPLGVFRSSGTLSLGDGVTLNGTVITEGASPEIRVLTGSTVKLNARNLPAINGTSQIYQLPLALVATSLKMQTNTDVTMNGFAMVWDEFKLEQGLASTKFSHTGNLVTSKLTVRGRDSFMMDALTWAAWKDDFDDDIFDHLLDRTYFFPDYMERYGGFTVKPNLTFNPTSSGVKPHWQDWSQPVYKKGAADAGLLWEVVRWEDEG
jgi:hypothetical protein